MIIIDLCEIQYNYNSSYSILSDCQVIITSSFQLGKYVVIKWQNDVYNVG